MFRQQQLTALLQGKKILIAGYGREGRSTEHLLQRLVPEQPYAIADGNDQIRSEALSGKYDTIVKSPGVPMRVLGGAQGVTSLTDIFLQVYADRVIGITGTKGKSTTASLVSHLLEGSVLAGNIGVPLFDIVDSLTPETVVVAELSCHQLEVLHRSPHIAAVLNLFQEHLDHYDSYLGYQMAKMQIGLHQQPTDYFFYCTDNATLHTLAGSLSLPGQVMPYSLGSATEAERALLDNCQLEGQHNLCNALLACRIVRAVTGKLPAAERLASFKGLHHRIEPVGMHGGCFWYDDSISTIPEATLAAVAALPRVDTLILGGYDRGIDYTPLIALMQSRSVHAVAFVGKAGRRIQQMLATANALPEAWVVDDDYSRIVPWCAKNTPQGGTVLLSPAAASYDSFKNFEHRGDFFAQQTLLL